jgi:putative peptidoglycan lipid II flippase
MALGTVVSRATGLIRQVLQAAALGTGLLASTYMFPRLADGLAAGR